MEILLVEEKPMIIREEVLMFMILLSTMIMNQARKRNDLIKIILTILYG